MAQIDTGRLTLEVERHGPPDRPALILIRGLGTQLIHWSPQLIAALVGHRFHVIAFDNRDTGLSQRFDHLGVPGQGDAPPYGLADMADDVASLMDALDLERAHLCGMSMGGMILQHFLHRHHQRAITATIVMSSSSAPGLARWSDEVAVAMRPVPGQRADRETAIAGACAGDMLWSSPGFPADPEARRVLHGRAYDRAYHPDGVARHYAATRQDGSRAELLAAISCPCLVVHGTADTIFPVEHGRDLAARIPGARLLEIEGMGHDLEGAIGDMLAEGIAGLAGPCAG